MKSKKPPAEALTESLTAERERRAVFLADIDRLVAARPDLLRAGDQVAIDANDEAQRAARQAADRADERIAVLAADLQNAEAQARVAQQQLLDNEASQAAQDAANELHRLWRQFVPRVRAAMRSVALADQLVKAANRGRTSGEPVTGVEARARLRPARPVKVLSEKKVFLWTFAETGAVITAAETIAKIEDLGRNRGRIERGTSGHSDVVRKEFLERIFVPATREDMPRPLAQTLVIPGLRAGDAPGWCAPPDSDVAAWADALENRDAIADDRQPVTELVRPDEQSAA